MTEYDIHMLREKLRALVCCNKCTNSNCFGTACCFSSESCYTKQALNEWRDSFLNAIKTNNECRLLIEPEKRIEDWAYILAERADIKIKEENAND
jgi:hypothetical protein